MRKLLFIFLLVFLTFSVNSLFGQTTLTAGDIALIGVQTDSPDSFDFVTLVDIETNTVVYFTDNGWSDGGIRGGEGTVTWTAPSAVTAGTVFNIDTISGLSGGGDQILVYQGTEANPTMIFAAAANSSVWQVGSDDSNQSDLPTGLVDGYTAVAAGAGTGPEDEYDNIWYSGTTTSGTKEELLTAIGNNANWTGNNSSYSPYTTNFTVNAGGGNPTVATPTISPAETDFFDSVDVTIISSTESATIYYTTDGNDPDTTSTKYTAPFQLTESKTVKAFAVKADHDDSAIAEKSYNKLTITEVSTILALRAGLTDGTIYRLTGEALLTYQESYHNRKYVQDATAGIMIEDTEGKITTSYNLNDGITGLTGTLSENYDGMLYFIPTEDPGLATSTGNTVTPIVVTIPELTASVETYETRLVTVQSVSFVESGSFNTGTDYTVNDGTNNLTFRTNFYNADYISTAIPSAVQHITGIVKQDTGTPEITARALTDFEEDSSAPLNAEFSASTTAIGEGSSIDFTNETSGGTPDYAYEWNFGDGSAESTETNPTHTYTTAGTYTVTLYVIDNDLSEDTEVKTDYITVTEPQEEGGVVILSELCDPTSNYQIDRYIEITNVGNASVNLAGWSVVAVGNGSDIFTWNLSGNIAPGVSLVCGDDEASGFTVSFREAAWSDSNGSWNGKTGDGAKLNDSSKGIVDQFLADDSINFENKTVTRNSDATTPQTTQNDSEWTATSVASPTDEGATPGSHTFEGQETLPVELTGFNATYTNVAEGASFVSIEWTTGSESNILGYYVLRNESEDLETAYRVNSGVETATNSVTGSSYSYIDDEIDTNTTYYYWLESVELSNTNEFFGPVMVKVEDHHDVEDIVIPQFTSLRSVYPNPFNPSTSVRFYVKEAQNVKINVYNVKGQLISELANDNYGQGFHDLVWNGKDNSGADCASGMYFFKMEAAEKTQIKKALLVK